MYGGQTCAGRRLVALDQARAIAIIAMLWAHFGPGVLERVGASQSAYQVSSVFTRLATPGFVVIFGMAIGMIYLPKLRDCDFSLLTGRLLRRAALLAVGAVVIKLYAYHQLLTSGESAIPVWLFATYSILTYYVLALLAMPLVLRLIRPSPMALSVVLGLSFWLIGIGLAFHIWPAGLEGTYSEFARLVLVSGFYAFLPLMGTALLAMPLGVMLGRLRRRQITAPCCAGVLACVGFASLAAGLVVCALRPESMVELLLGDRAPNRPSYFLVFASGTLLMSAVLLVLESAQSWWRRLSYPLTLFGQRALLIYVAHGLVLPATDVMRNYTALSGDKAALAALAMFIIFCGYVLVQRHYQLAGRDDPPRAPALAASPAT